MNGLIALGAGIAALTGIGGGIGIGIPTTQKKAAGVAILVPAAAVVPADQLPAR